MTSVKKDDIEFRNLEWDHLTKEEQFERFGQYYGPKTKGVAGIYAYESKKAETKKCILLCLYCHTLKTMERNGASTRRRKKKEMKKAYNNTEKCKVGNCQLCKCGVNMLNLSYYEWDHIDPTKKRHDISEVVRSDSTIFTIEYLIEELHQCRLLCRFCHRIHSGEQKKVKFAVARNKKRERVMTDEHAHDELKKYKSE